MDEEEIVLGAQRLGSVLRIAAALLVAAAIGWAGFCLWRRVT